jgi:putative transposase
MARPLRLEFEGAVYHLTSRGNAREKVFVDDRDRARFLKILADAAERFSWICHAYGLFE